MVPIFIIKVDESLYEVDREKLEDQSDYFKALFKSNMIEILNNQVDLSESSSNEIIRFVVDYINDNERELNFTRTNISSILGISLYLQIGKLKQRCSEYVSEQLEILATDEMLEMIADFSLDAIRDRYLDRIRDDFRFTENPIPRYVFHVKREINSLPSYKLLY